MSVFQTNTFVDGIWTTRTVDADAVIRAWQEEQPEDDNLNLDLGEPPVYGLLTKTLVNSPVVHWILPARVRDEGKNDIVFIGVCKNELSLSVTFIFFQERWFLQTYLSIGRQTTLLFRSSISTKSQWKMYI